MLATPVDAVVLWMSSFCSECIGKVPSLIGDSVLNLYLCCFGKQNPILGVVEGILFQFNDVFFRKQLLLVNHIYYQIDDWSRKPSGSL